MQLYISLFFFSSRRRHTRWPRDWSSDVCSSDLCEHQPVFTAGKRTTPDERPSDGTPVIDVDRGGKITWHGPGQLVGYPILRLAEPIDVVGYVRALERVLIDVLARVGTTGERVEGRAGVWMR